MVAAVSTTVAIYAREGGETLTHPGGPAHVPGRRLHLTLRPTYQPSPPRAGRHMASDAPADTQRLKHVRHTAAWGERAVRLRRAIAVSPSRAHTPILLPPMVQVPPGTARLHAGERLWGGGLPGRSVGSGYFHNVPQPLRTDGLNRPIHAHCGPAPQPARARGYRVGPRHSPSKSNSATVRLTTVPVPQPHLHVGRNLESKRHSQPVRSERGR
eukprot:SAG25_NODE_2809_length_1375_cov_1.568966_2_plen_212_part_01